MENVTIETSKKFTIDWRDAAKGLVVTIISAVLTSITTMLQSGGFNIKAVGLVALIAGLSYLTKNFFQPSQTIVTAAPPADVQVTDNKVTITEDKPTT